MVYSDYYSFKNNNKLLYSNVPNNFNLKVLFLIHQ